MYHLGDGIFKSPSDRKYSKPSILVANVMATSLCSSDIALLSGFSSTLFLTTMTYARLPDYTRLYKCEKFGSMYM